MGRTEVNRVVRLAVLTALAGPLAACGSSGSTTGAATSASATATSPSSTAAPSSTASAAAFVNIVEPFDPGHPARTRPGLANCGSESTTIAIEGCYEIKTENIDVQIDVVQQAKYQSATPAQQTAILTGDSAWLAARQPVCAVAFNTGGTIDGISASSCLLQESTARLDAVKGITPPAAKLMGTDSMDPNQLSWYTTPEGSRIAEISTQGDTTGGALVAWVIIGGADGFVINPKQFYFQDKSFTVAGTPESPSPASYRVATGKEYQFGMDYPHLDNDPNANKSAAGYFYAPGTPVAVWGG
ncbi:MAG: lysozyme inhibitor LprI family protein [Streptosporangiaceae bacterium]|jgi:uncharacterized protein YecT (DUF1311 family)